MTTPATSRRAARAAKPRRGDAREQAILDAAEQLLDQASFAELTVEAIAHGAGIGRSALYFYFASKQAVLAALVERTSVALGDRAAPFFTDRELALEDALEQAMRDTAAMWREHGAVARAAVEESHAIPAVRDAWEDTIERFARSAADLIVRRGAAEQDPLVMGRALVWMTERSFYALTCGPHTSEDEEQLISTLTVLWRRSVLG